MNTIVEQMLQKYTIDSKESLNNALKEIIQEIVLCGLSRTAFFSKAAFYGGTALRIFYGLDRFSEDIDFSLLEKDNCFNLQEYFSAIQNELESFGLKTTISQKEKTLESAVQSAFIKGDTKIHILNIEIAKKYIQNFGPKEQFQIKFEVDTDPPASASFEYKTSLRPIPFQVRLYDEPSLFAGKLHALLCRKWKQRVKGRDFYDYLWYLSRNTSVNIEHLQKRMEQTGHWNPTKKLTLSKLKELLIEKFNTTDFLQAKTDVKPFIRDSRSLELWAPNFFIEATEKYLV